MLSSVASFAGIDRKTVLPALTLTNASFTSPALTGNALQQSTNYSFITGWVFSTSLNGSTNSGFNMAIARANAPDFNGNAYTLPTGTTQYATFTCVAGSFDTVRLTQSVTFPVAGRYQMSFYVCPRNATYGNTYYTNSPFKAYVNSVEVASWSVPSATSGWARVLSAEFSATATALPLAFVLAATSGGVLLTKVSVWRVG